MVREALVLAALLALEVAAETARPVGQRLPAVVRFLGDPGGLTAQVVVLDSSGTVRWLHGSGFSEVAGADLVETVRRLTPGGDHDGTGA